MNEEQVAKRKQLAEKKYLAYREFFTSELGEEILSDLMRAAHYNTTVIGRDPYETYYNEGQRGLLLQIIRTAKLTPKEINRITKKLDEEDNYLL